jgi:hypothetical protein
MLTVKIIDGGSFTNKEVYSLINKKLTHANINCSNYVEDGVLVFKELATGRIFESKINNIIKMSASDKRIAKLGRTFLNTKRLTRSQYDTVIDTIVGLFERLHIQAEVVYKDSVWYQGRNRITSNIKVPNQFAESSE